MIKIPTPEKVSADWQAVGNFVAQGMKEKEFVVADWSAEKGIGIKIRETFEKILSRRSVGLLRINPTSPSSVHWTSNTVERLK